MDKWQYVKSSQSLIYMYMYIIKKTQTTCQRLELQTFVVSTVKDTIATNYILEEQAYFCSLKGQGCYMSEKQTRNFYSLKKRTLQTFCSLL